MRVAWLAAYDNLLLHAVFEQEQAPRQVQEELAGLDGAMFPAFLPSPAGGTFVFADTLGFHAVGMVPDVDREPKAAVAVLARTLGESESTSTPNVGEQSAAVLGNEIVKYIECHESSRLLRMHALRAGDGLTIARALGRVHRHYSGAGDEPDNEVAEGADIEATAPAFSLDLYPSPEQRAIAGRFIAEAREKRRSGAGVLATDDQWMLESISLPGGVALPRLRWARKETGEPKTAAHLAVAFDTFESRVEIDTGAAPTAPFRAFGLLSFFERGFAAAPTPSWRSVVPGPAAGRSTRRSGDTPSGWTVWTRRSWTRSPGTSQKATASRPSARDGAGPGPPRTRPVMRAKARRCCARRSCPKRPTASGSCTGCPTGWSPSTAMRASSTSTRRGTTGKSTTRTSSTACQSARTSAACN